MEALLEALDARGKAISARVIREMYAHPFWTERFGDRGRGEADKDGDFHIAHLREALVTEDEEALPRYARWLRSVLTARGMCTHHLADNLLRLGDALGQELPDGVRARAYLYHASAALHYDAGPARHLQDHADPIVAALDAREWPGDPALTRETHRELVSYLADAVAQERPALFADHVVWLRAFWERRGVPDTALDAQLAALSAHLSHEHAPADDAVQAIAFARDRLAPLHGDQVER